MLARNAALRGVLFDQPHVVAGASQVLESAGVAEHCTVEGGSFFDSVPAGHDAYVMKHVLHDWDDAPAIAILRTCRQAIPSGGRLLVIEHTIDPPNAGPAGKFSDLNMLVSPGGQERTREEDARLFEAAGFRLGGVALAGDHSVISGVPA